MLLHHGGVPQRTQHLTNPAGFRLLPYYVAVSCDPLSGFHYRGDDSNHKWDGFHHKPYRGGGAPYQHLNYSM